MYYLYRRSLLEISRSGGRPHDMSAPNDSFLVCVHAIQKPLLICALWVEEGKKAPGC